MRTRSCVAATLLLLTASTMSGIHPPSPPVPEPVKYTLHDVMVCNLVSFRVTIEPGDIEDGPLGDTPLFWFHDGPTWRWQRTRWHWYIRFGGYPQWPIAPGSPRHRGGVHA